METSNIISKVPVEAEICVTRKKMDNPEEVISKLLYKKYKECPPYDKSSRWNNIRPPSNDFVTVVKKGVLNIYFNYIDKIDTMSINYILVEICDCVYETKNKKNTKKVAIMRIYSEKIRVVDTYMRDTEEVTYMDDSACRLLYNNKIMDFKHTKKELSYEDINELVESVVFTIKNLVFDRYVGKFILKSEKENRDKEIKAYKSIFDCETVNLDIGECVVCMEDTRTKSHCCGKNLCNCCWDKIKVKNNNEDDYDTIMPCPNCRRDLREDNNYM
jgi:hypothetical protein